MFITFKNLKKKLFIVLQRAKKNGIILDKTLAGTVRVVNYIYLNRKLSLKPIKNKEI